MTELQAKKLLVISTEFFEKYCEFLRNNQSSLSEQDYNTLKSSIGKVMGTIHERLNMPIYKEFKQLVPEQLKGVRGL